MKDVGTNGIDLGSVSRTPRPVRNMARAGAQTPVFKLPCTRTFSNVMPTLAIESMCGVMGGPSFAPTKSKRRSSAMMMRMFGLVMFESKA